MTPQRLIAALALSSASLTTWAQTCQFREAGGLLINPKTGLEVSKCLVGQEWLSGRCSGTPRFFNWTEAMRLYEKSEWRLPTESDQRTFSFDGRTSAFFGCLSSDVFPKYLRSWTSSKAHDYGKDVAFTFNLDGTGVYYSGIADSMPVLLVRSARSAGSVILESSISNLDTPERLQAAQSNQQQADRAFAGKRRAHDDNANTEQPTPGPRENTVTNRGPVRVNVAYCLDSHKRAYSGSLKCSAQRFGYTSLEAGQTVEVLPPNSGQQALTFSCKHPAKPYDVEFANDGLSGRCAAY